VNLLLVAGFGGALGFAGWKAVKLGHCRNRVLAMVLAVPLAGVPLAASYAWDWQHAISTIQEKNPGLSRGDIAEEVTFTRFLEIKKEAGWKMKSSTMNGGMVTFIWIVEGLTVFALAFFITGAAAADPYCEKCGKWCKGHTFQVPGTTRADADPYLSQKKLGDLVQIESRGGDPNSSLHFTVTTCEGCPETAYLTVAEQQIQQKKKQTQTVKHELVRHAVLGGSDREHAVYRAQAAVGQKLVA
jgi:hypothetical protein